MKRTKPGHISTLQPMEDPVLKQVDVLWRNCGPWRAHGGTALSWRTTAHGKNPCRSGEKCEEEWVAERSCYRPATALLCLQCLAKGEVEKLGKKEWSWVWEKEMGWGSRCLSFCLCFSPSNTILTGNKFNYFSPGWVCFACDGNWQLISTSLSWLMSCWAGQVRVAGWAAGNWLRSTHHRWACCNSRWA